MRERARTVFFAFLFFAALAAEFHLENLDLAVSAIGAGR